MIVIDYDVQRWNLRECAEIALRTANLEHLHAEFQSLSVDAITQHSHRLGDQLRDTLTPRTIATYAHFLYEVVQPRVGFIAGHQARPTFRVHLHGGQSISAHHRDREGGQTTAMLVLWVPMTDSWGTNGLWVESRDGANDHQPIALKYGQVLVFNGFDLSHGSVGNQTGSTRVSCDMRFKLGSAQRPS